MIKMRYLNDMGKRSRNEDDMQKQRRGDFLKEKK